MLTLTKTSRVERAVLLTSWDKVNRHIHTLKSEALYNDQGLAHMFVTLFLVSSRCATHCRCLGDAHGNGLTSQGPGPSKVNKISTTSRGKGSEDSKITRCVGKKHDVAQSQLCL